jgi:hypothetical protein
MFFLVPVPEWLVPVTLGLSIICAVAMVLTGKTAGEIVSYAIVAAIGLALLYGVYATAMWLWGSIPTKIDPAAKHLWQEPEPLDQSINRVPMTAEEQKTLMNESMEWFKASPETIRYRLAQMRKQAKLTEQYEIGKRCESDPHYYSADLYYTDRTKTVCEELGYGS